MRYAIILALLFFSISQPLIANNIQVSNVSYTGDVGDPIYQINFDVAWENSWRTSTYESNYDAAWIFVKYRGDFDNLWVHGAIASVSGGSGGMEVVLPSDGKGFFLQRSTDGIGDVSYTNIVINWDLDFDFFPDETIDVCVYAIEMVYIPEGPFQLGDGGGSEGSFKEGNSTSPYTVLSENVITLGGTASSNLSITPSGFVIPNDFSDATTRTLPGAFPKGYDAYYCMKYEISQGQYAAFLNTLTSSQAIARFEDIYGFNGYTIRTTGIPTTYVAEAPERATIYLKWNDIATYADWSGLRPMSEFEYEKACRGTRQAKFGEYAWGASAIYTDVYDISDEGASEEILLGGLEGLGNCIIGSTHNGSPARCGIFAGSFESPNRTEAGAGYYGHMELTGNVNEIVICVTKPEGRSFNGAIHGDGYISASVVGWPSMGAGAGNGIGVGYRGGSFESGPSYIQVSDRLQSFNFGESHEFRQPGKGGRLVRSNF